MKSISRKTAPARGFTIFEVIFWLILLSAITLLVSQIFAISMRVMRETPIREQAVTRVDKALALLRRDVWSAHAIRVVDPNHLELETPEGVIHWRSQNGELRRAAGDSPDRSWRDLPRCVFSNPSPAGIQVQLQTPRRAPEFVTVVSQRLLGGAR